MALVSIQPLHELLVISDALLGFLNEIFELGKQILEMSTPALGLRLLFCRSVAIDHFSAGSCREPDAAGTTPAGARKLPLHWHEHPLSVHGICASCHSPAQSTLAALINKR
jgi:hypothetical protein